MMNDVLEQNCIAHKVFSSKTHRFDKNISWGLKKFVPQKNGTHFFFLFIFTLTKERRFQERKERGGKFHIFFSSQDLLTSSASANTFKKKKPLHTQKKNSWAQKKGGG